MDLQERDTPSLAESAQSSKPSSGQQASEPWEVVEEPRGRLGAEGVKPERQEGHLLKKRKWPLKGWHKRYFVLEDGILHYATTRQDVAKGKLHGSIDVRLSVMSVNKKAQRIDLDTEDNIYHLKIKSQDLFQNWVAQLRAHRLDVPGTTHRKLLTAGGTSALPGVGAQEKVSSWLRDSDGLDRCSHALSECQGKLQELHRLLQSLESLHRIPSAPVIPTHQASGTTERPKKGKRTTRMWCTQSFAKDDTIGRVGRLHGSVPNLSRYMESRDSSGPRGLPPPDYAHLQRSFWALAQKVHSSLSSILATLSTERDRLRDLHRGSELSRIGVPGGQRRLHSLSTSSDTTADSFSSLNPEEQEALYMKGRELTPQLSQSSVLSLADSHTEFFDACEVLLSASSSENEGSEEEESYTSEVTTSLSEEVLQPRGAERCQKGSAPGPPRCLGGRQPLPSSPSVLLPSQVYVAAFAVSAYCSTYHRAGCKPFNPVLGETYECERPDRGFRFISEQVSHHPPISACHAESENFVFWQDMKWKNKFWGKSLEIVPVGTVNVSLPRFGDHFEWNKVTSCIHNILSGQRWIEHYGEGAGCRSEGRGDLSSAAPPGIYPDPGQRAFLQLPGPWPPMSFCSFQLPRSQSSRDSQREEPAPSRRRGHPGPWLRATPQCLWIRSLPAPGHGASRPLQVSLPEGGRFPSDGDRRVRKVGGGQASPAQPKSAPCGCHRVRMCPGLEQARSGQACGHPSEEESQCLTQSGSLFQGPQ
ncbi:oxysterol-binding protein-related protein 7 [Fukomys damarensis]|uniref:oxysterol-binding protein-related protein 7 n=1 Tax=Fukomys damarensis TaxID=885580 RepID=UPI00053F4B23|nr:oxysterol-binding protein-related protein 7 [Fukomys damarensis]